MNELTGEIILNELSKHFLTGKDKNLNDLILEYFPTPSTHEFMTVRRILDDLEKYNLAKFSQHTSLGGTKAGVPQGLQQVPIWGHITQEGMKHVESAKQKSESAIHVSGSPGTVVNLHSPNSNISVSINIAEVNNAISQLKDAIVNSSVDESIKQQALTTVETISSDISNGVAPKDASAKLIDIVSKIASVGSFAINLVRLLAGI